MVWLLVLQTMIVAVASASASSAVGFSLDCGDDEKVKYGVYYVGNFSDSSRYIEKLLGVFPSNSTGSKFGVQGESGHGWVVRSSDFRFRIGFTIDVAPARGNTDNKFLLVFKNFGEDDIGVRWHRAANATTLKSLELEYHHVPDGNEIRIGYAKGKDRLLLKLEEPRRLEL
eukprot:TRINITY_DN4651_c0_g1_i3.p1 TRINITY_DN4651_c0_g1~~TRINITY_DN4651_c0_g1_i3.p1  ORF type:complete len:171 (-),score=31.55 TRINITY_DN4651_c0_g1_i3:141-653(-)